MWLFAIPAALIGLAFFPRKDANGQTYIPKFKDVFGPFQPFGPYAWENMNDDNRYDTLFKLNGDFYRIDPKILKSMAIQESGLKPAARNSTTSARGLMQMTQAACKDVNENWNNQDVPSIAIRSGAKYLRWLMDSYKMSIDTAIRSYFAGAGTIIDGDKGKPFKQSWQPESYRFANNNYLPKIKSRAANVTIDTTA